MQVTDIPFVKHIGIKRKEEGTLKLEATEAVRNHIQTIHTSAQFTLEETQSGLYGSSLGLYRSMILYNIDTTRKITKGIIG